LVRYALLEGLPGLVHALSTRVGGCSQTPFAGLNLGLHVGDDPQRVLANRARVLAALGFDPGQLVLAAQVHGSRVARVDLAEAGRGSLDGATALPDADALVTATPGLLLGVLVADCAPILLADPVSRAVAAVHAGWRGTAEDVAGRTVRAMAAAFGTQPGDLRAVIGPSIGPAHFEVGPEVVAAFDAALGPDASGLVRPGRGDRAFVDLPEANRLLLRRAGLDPGRIQVDRTSTAERLDRFFSHRAEGGRTGRFGAFVGWSPS
jgi:YfiH family protein